LDAEKENLPPDSARDIKAQSKASTPQSNDKIDTKADAALGDGRPWLDLTQDVSGSSLRDASPGHFSDSAMSVFIDAEFEDGKTNVEASHQAVCQTLARRLDAMRIFKAKFAAGDANAAASAVASCREIWSHQDIGSFLAVFRAARKYSAKSHLGINKERQLEHELDTAIALLEGMSVVKSAAEAIL
jgi:hypothetical protein